MFHEEDFEGPLGELEPLLGYKPAFDEKGECCLSAEGSLPVTLRRDTERQCLEISSLLALDMPESLGRELFQRLLTLAHDPGDAPGVVVGLDPDVGLPFLFIRVPLQTLPPGEFPDTLNMFLAVRDGLAHDFTRAMETNGPCAL